MHRVPSLALAAFLAAAPLSAQANNQGLTGRCLTPDSIDVRGLSRVSRESVIGTAGLAAKSTLNFPSIQRAIRDLFATKDFEDVGITCDVPDPAQAHLVITVKERPVLGRVDVTGMDRISKRQVEDRVELILGRPVDPAEVALAMRRIDSLYQANGYYLARVRPETTMVEDRIGITFRIEEGRRLAVAGIKVEGNSNLADETVVKAMKTRPEGFWWWKKGEFDEDVFAADLGENLPKLYGERGFVDFQLDRDTVMVDRERGKALIELDLREGPQFRVKSFEVVGNRRFTSEQIATLYPFTAQDPSLTDRVQALIKRRPPATDIFDRTRWEEATQAVTTMYNNEGYIYADVRPVVERDPTDSAAVLLRWDIVERTPAIINRVEVLGNDFTAESCIRDQLIIIPGDVYNQERIIHSWRSIGNLGFFETPIAFPDVRQANEQGDVDIVFRVKEKRTGQVNFGASVGQGTGLGGFIGLEQPNLFGKCKRGNINWQFGQYINDFSASYTDPNIKGSMISGQLTGYRSLARYRIADFGRTTRIGGSTRVGFPFPGSRRTRVFASYGLEAVRFGEDGLLGTVTTNECAGCLRSTLGFDITRDTRLDMPFATEGQLQTLSVQMNGGPLGGSATFTRYTAEFRNYTLLARLGGKGGQTAPLRLTFGLSARSGAVFGDPKEFFFSQQFALGGVQFGEMLRGYPEFSITPLGFTTNTTTYNAQRESFGSAFFASTAEIGLRFTQSVYVNAFYDVGNLWAEPRDFDPTRLFRGAGLGLSTVTPLGPLGVDYAYGFDRRDANGRPKPAWQLHFRLGQVF
jgi:outer membrane protein insertion porin family